MLNDRQGIYDDEQSIDIIYWIVLGSENNVQDSFLHMMEFIWDQDPEGIGRLRLLELSTNFVDLLNFERVMGYTKDTSTLFRYDGTVNVI